MANPIINLRISGTKRRQGGFVPLVNVGVFPGVEGDNMDRVPLVAEKPAYIVKHAADYILYQLIDRQVKSCDADAPGVLSIAVAISSDWQLANNASPYRLLREVYEKFLNTYMTPVSDGRHSFIDVDNDSEIFRELLSGYSLEKRKTPYFRMTPAGQTGILCVAPADLEEFFRNTQYKEFAPFKDVEVGCSCGAQVTPVLEKLQIPLPPIVFDIYVNGVKTGATMQSPSDNYTATAPSTSLYDYKSVEFSLQELLESPSGMLEKEGAKMSLDFQKNRIDCNLKKVDINYKFVYEWRDNVGGDAQEKIKAAIERGSLQLKFGVTDANKTLSGNYFVKATELKGQKMNILPSVFESFSLVVSSEVQHKERQILVKITINRKAMSSQGNYRSTSVQRLAPNSIVTEQSHQNMNDDAEMPKRNKLDVKSLLVGFVLGLLVGLAVWWMVDSFFKTDTASKEADSEEVQNDSLTSDNAENNATFPTENTSEPKGVQIESGTPQEENNNTQVELGKVKEGENKETAEKENSANAALAKAKEAKEKAAQAAKEKAELIKFISKKPTLNEYRQHSGYGHLSKEEKTTIEVFLTVVHDFDNYVKKHKLNKRGKNKLKDLKNQKYTFRSMEGIENVRGEISKIINEEANK